MIFSRDELQSLFQNPYRLDVWQDFLHRHLGVTHLLARPERVVVPPTEAERGMTGRFLGEISETLDHFKIGLFDFTVPGEQVKRRRVGLRNLLVPWLRADYDAALVTFHSTDPGVTDWRVSFICDLKGEETAAKRYSFVFGNPAGSYHTAVERFSALPPAGPVPFAALRSVFSVEALSKEFYTELYAWYLRALSPEAGVTFPNDPETARDDRENLNVKIIRLITRLLFVWFIRQKNLVPSAFFDPGALGGVLKRFDPLSRTSGDYYNAILQNLFFGTLNTPVLDDETGTPMRRFASGTEQQPGNLYRYAEMFAIPETEAVALFARIPYMNGGLFECLDKPKSIYKDEFAKYGREMLYDGFSRNAARDPKTHHFKRRAHIPNYLFFDTDERAPGLFPLLSRYNFTVEENATNDADVSLDPELLGRVFENLLASYNPETQVTARNATGSFYTPREIVDFMVKESLDAYMAPVAGKPPAEQLERLFSIKVLDPACGSGAFPMGMLHAIVDRAQALAGASVSPADAYAVKLRVIENCIFGVDIQSIAMMITKLRFFISLICEQGEPDWNDPRGNYGVNTLPNLETKFVAANTLVALKRPPQSGCNLLDAVFIDGLRRDLHDVRHRYFGARTRAEKRRLRTEDERLRDELASRLSQGYLLDSDNASQLAAWNPYDQVAVSPFFDPEWMFGIKDGFDVVIGNPPYIQLQNNHGELATLYAPCGFETFARTGDIYCLFYERAWQLLKNDGRLCYITSNKWMRAGYGENLRKFLAEKTNPEILVDFAGERIFESATVDTNILLFQKGSPNAGKTLSAIGAPECRNDLSAFVRQHGFECTFDTSESWVILSPIEQSIKRKIEAVGVPLKDWDVSINYGIKTGCNEAFIIDEDRRAEILSWCRTGAERKKTAELIRPILRGRDIKRYGYDWAGLYLIATHNGIPEKGIPRVDVNDYPAIKRHLDQYWDKISVRADMGDTPYNLRSCAYMDDFSKPKIVWGNLCLHSSFAKAPGGMFANAPSPMLVPYTDYLLAVLNSKLGDWYIRQLGVTRNGGYFEYKPMFVEQLPVPQLDAKEQKAFFSFLPPGASLQDVQDAIDENVFKLYGLSSQERDFILNND